MTKSTPPVEYTVRMLQLRGCFVFLEFYIDQFFLDQFLTGYLLLALTVRLARVQVSRIRLGAGSLINAGIMCFLVCRGCLEWYPVSMLLMGTSVFLQKNWRKYLFHMILFVFVTFCFAGVFEGILAILRPSLTAGIALAAVVCRFILRRLWKKKLECSRTATVKLQWQQNTATLKGMVDTGNHLKEPLTGKPVSIIDEKSARKLLGENWEKRKGFFLIPYHSIGMEKGWMKGVIIDRMRIESASDSQEIVHPVFAISSSPVNLGGAYQVILHPEHAAAAGGL